MSSETLCVTTGSRCAEEPPMHGRTWRNISHGRFSPAAVPGHFCMLSCFMVITAAIVTQLLLSRCQMPRQREIEREGSLPWMNRR